MVLFENNNTWWNLGISKQRQPAASPARSREASWGEGCRGNQSQWSPSTSATFSVSSHFLKPLSYLGNGTVKETGEGRWMGPKLKGGMFMEMGCAGWICKRFYFLWTRWKPPKLFCHEVAGRAIEEGFLTLLVWVCSHVRRNWPWKVAILHPQWLGPKAFFSSTSFPQRTTEKIK